MHPLGLTVGNCSLRVKPVRAVPAARVPRWTSRWVTRASDEAGAVHVDTWGRFLADRRRGADPDRVPVFARNALGLWMALTFAGISAVMAVFAIFAWPLWAFSVLTLDLLVLYGLTARNQEFRRT